MVNLTTRRIFLKQAIALAGLGASANRVKREGNTTAGATAVPWYRRTLREELERLGLPGVDTVEL